MHELNGLSCFLLNMITGRASLPDLLHCTMGYVTRPLTVMILACSSRAAIHIPLFGHLNSDEGLWGVRASAGANA